MRDNDGYKALASAIVLQAVNDFKKAAKEYKKGKRKEQNERTMKEVINFIKSDWYKVLTDLSPDLVIERLMEELEDDK